MLYNTYIRLPSVSGQVRCIMMRPSPLGGVVYARSSTSHVSIGISAIIVFSHDHQNTGTGRA